MTCTSKLQNNIRNGFPILDNPTKVLSFMIRTLLVLKLLKCRTPDGGHLEFVQYGRHRGSPSWLPRVIGRRWLYLPLAQKLCLWNDLNNYLIKPPDYLAFEDKRDLYCIYINKIVVLASEPVGGRSRATELPCSLSIFTDGHRFACSAQQTLCLFNKL